MNYEKYNSISKKLADDIVATNGPILREDIHKNKIKYGLKDLTDNKIVTYADTDVEAYNMKLKYSLATSHSYEIIKVTI